MLNVHQNKEGWNMEKMVEKMVEINIEIKGEEEFSTGINLVKKLMVTKKESSSKCGMDRYKYEEGTDKVTGNKEIEQATYRDICCYIILMDARKGQNAELQIKQEDMWKF